MNKKSKLLLSSLATIAMSASLAVGGTYALFTDKADVNIAISSGTVDVTATVENAKVYSGVWNSANGAYESIEQGNLTFLNDIDGTPSVEFTANSLTIEKMTPMDKVTFDIRIQNGSNVKASYQTVVGLVDGIDLFKGLVVTIGEYAPYEGMTAYSAWQVLPQEDIVVPVSIELPYRAINEETWESENNQYMGKSCEISYSVRAVQGNAYVSNDGTVGNEANTKYIYNENDLVLFANAVENGNDFAGETIKMMKDISYGSTYGRRAVVSNSDIFPIGGDVDFNGTFDGNGKVISGLTIAGEEYVGLFATAGRQSVIKNVTLDNATISGNHFVGGIVGWSVGKVENCVVKNSTISATPNATADGYDNGDKVGGIVGYGYYAAGEPCYFEVVGCTVENVTVKGYRDLGGIAGMAGTKCSETGMCFCGKVLVRDNTAINVNVVADQTVGYYGDKASNAGLILGRNACAIELDVSNVANGGNTFTADGWHYDEVAGVYYVYSGKGFKAINDKMVAGDFTGKKITIELLKDIDMTDYAWTMVSKTNGRWVVDGVLKELNGNGHIISNMVINGQGMFSRWTDCEVTIKDVTFDNAHVNSRSINSSILCVQTYVNATLDNVDVKNSLIEGGYKVAPLLATVYNESASSITATLKNCDVENTTVKATQYDFCTTGMVAFVYDDDNDKVVFENCTVTNVNLIAPNTYGYDGHAWVYTTGAGAPGDGSSYFNEVAGVVVTNCTFTLL